MPVTSVPDKTHVVFKTTCHSCRIMIFKNRYIYKYICLKQNLMYLGFLKLYSSRNFNLLIIAFRVTRDNFCTCIFCSFLNSRVFITIYPVITCVIKYINLFGTCFKTMFYNPFNQQWIGICCKIRNHIPTNIRFNQYFLSFLHKCPHSSQFLYSKVEHCIRIATHYGDHIIFWRERCR